MHVNFLSAYSDKKSCHTSTTLQTSIARFVSDIWASCTVWHNDIGLHTVGLKVTLESLEVLLGHFWEWDECVFWTYTNTIRELEDRLHWTCSQKLTGVASLVTESWKPVHGHWFEAENLTKNKRMSMNSQVQSNDPGVPEIYFWCQIFAHGKCLWINTARPSCTNDCSKPRSSKRVIPRKDCFFGVWMMFP